MRESVPTEVEANGHAGLAEMMLVAHQVGLACPERGIPLVARGSATCSLVVWALGLFKSCPLDDGLYGNLFVHDGRPEFPYLDLEVPSEFETTVAALVQQAAAPWTNRSVTNRSELPAVNALRLGISVSLGSRQAVRVVAAALDSMPRA